MFVLNDNEIKKEIKELNLISDFINLEKQLTPNGFDLTLKEVFKIEGAGEIDFSNNERKFPEFNLIEPEKRNPEDKYGWWFLKKGSYKIKANEDFRMPLNLIAIARTRSSLLRSGAIVNSGVWDAGFEGKVEFLLDVVNEKGIWIKQNARVLQVIFFKMNETNKGYEGVHKHLE